MARMVAVASADDPRVADYVSLTDVRLRRSLEARHGLFIAEGEKVIGRAVAAGYRMRSLLVTRERLAAIPGLADSMAGPVYLLSDAAARDLTGYRVHRGALASMERRPLPAVAEVLASPRPAGGPEDAAQGAAASEARPAGPPRRIVVLEDIVDHGNVGGIFRCAAGLGVDAVLLSPRCADPLYRRAVKVSMGAVFAIPYARMTDWRNGLAELRAAGFRLLALTPDQAAVPIGQVPMAGRTALLLGTEGDGLSSRWLQEAGEAVCIPMGPGAMAAGVDSLNVVAAAAIACHSLVSDAMP